MSSSCDSCCDKDEQLLRLQKEIETLRLQQQQNKNTSSPSSSVSPFLSTQAHLTKAEVERYSRQALLPECGPEGTKAFLDARVVVIGCGGLGSTAILFLAASGIGHLVLVDADVVDRSNLHRQVIHPDNRVGVPKVESAKLSAHALNPTIKIDTFEERFSAENAMKIMEDATIVLDCSDNVATRYLVNDACVRKGLALVSGAAMRWDGQLSVYNLPLDPMNDENRSPTYRCMHPEPPPVSTLGGCSDIGVFGPVPGVVGILQALEALKCILHLESLNNIKIKERKRQEAEKLSNGNTTNSTTIQHQQQHTNSMASGIMAGRMLVWDAYMSTFRTMKMRPRSVAGVEKAKQGELKSLGDIYDGCTLEVVSDAEVEIHHVDPGAVLKEIGLKTKKEEDDCDNDDESDKRRRQREEDGEQNQEDKSIINTVAHVKNQLRDYLNNNNQNSKSNNGKKNEENSTSDLATTTSNTQQPNEDSDGNNSNKKEFQKLKIVLFLDVRKSIQRRLCCLEDLYEIPSFSPSTRTLTLHLGLPFAELQKKANTFMQAFEQTNSEQQEQERSNSIEHEVSLELFLSELLLIGSSPSKEIAQTSEFLRDLISPENVESFEIFTLCRRGIDSAKSAILLEKLRRSIRKFREGKTNQDSSLYHQQHDASSPFFSTCTDLFISSSATQIKNIKGGLNAWSAKADDDFPYY